MTRFRTLSIAAIALLGFIGSANAAVIVLDDFSGSSLDSLQGTTADVGGVWAGSNDALKADGSFVVANARNQYQATGGLVVGKIYELSLDVTLGSSGFNDGRIEIGFSQDTAANGAKTGDPAYAMLSVDRQNGIVTADGVKRTIGPSGAGELAIGDVIFDTAVQLKVRLDLTNAADYVATFFYNGVELDSVSIGTPALPQVFIASRRADPSSSVDNFLLEEVPIPEPASIALLGLGGLLIARRRQV